MKRRIISSLLAIILMISVVAVGTSAAAAVDLSDYTASDSTVDFHIKEIYSRIDVAEYRALDEVVAYANALKSAAVNGTSVSDISISWNGSEYGLEEFCDEIVFPVIPMGSGARKAADAVMNDSSLWPLGTPVKDISQTVYDSASYTEVYNLWKHLRDDHKDGFLSVAEFVAEKAQLETKIKELKTLPELPTFRIAAANLLITDSIAINFKVNKDVYEAYENVYAEITRGTDTVTVTNPTYHESDGKYYFTYSGIGPQAMKDSVTITLHGTAGSQEYTKTISYSVYQYCTSQLKGSNEAFKTVVTDLLNYGAAAQIYRNYKTDDLANAGIDQSYASQTLTAPVNQLNTKFAVIDNPTVSWRGAALNVASKVSPKLQFKAADITGLSVKFVVNGREYVVDTFEPATTTDCYYVLFEGISPVDMRTPFTATVYKDGVAVSNTLQYSIQTYVVGKTTAGTGLNDLLIAMLKFGDSCAAYIS